MAGNFPCPVPSNLRVSALCVSDISYGNSRPRSPSDSVHVKSGTMMYRYRHAMPCHATCIISLSATILKIKMYDHCKFARHLQSTFALSGAHHCCLVQGVQLGATYRAEH
jgi:hypothetical protein